MLPRFNIPKYLGHYPKRAVIRSVDISILEKVAPHRNSTRLTYKIRSGFLLECGHVVDLTVAVDQNNRARCSECHRINNQKTPTIQNIEKLKELSLSSTIDSQCSKCNIHIGTKNELYFLDSSPLCNKCFKLLNKELINNLPTEDS